MRRRVAELMDVDVADPGLSRTPLDRLRDPIGRHPPRTSKPQSLRVGVAVADARCPPVRWVDAVLLDAPCLGTGTFARHPDARWRVTPDALAALVRGQAELLASASTVVRPGGLLVYATCSLEPEDNEAQVEGFLETHADFQREPPDDALPTLLSQKGDLMTLPQRDRMDGAYAARLRRAA